MASIVKQPAPRSASYSGVVRPSPPPPPSSHSSLPIPTRGSARKGVLGPLPSSADVLARHRNLKSIITRVATYYAHGMGTAQSKPAALRAAYPTFKAKWDAALDAAFYSLRGSTFLSLLPAGRGDELRGSLLATMHQALEGAVQPMFDTIESLADEPSLLAACRSRLLDATLLLCTCVEYAPELTADADLVSVATAFITGEQWVRGLTATQAALQHALERAVFVEHSEEESLAHSLRDYLHHANLLLEDLGPQLAAMDDTCDPLPLSTCLGRPDAYANPRAKRILDALDELWPLVCMRAKGQHTSTKVAMRIRRNTPFRCKLPLVVAQTGTDSSASSRHGSSSSSSARDTTSAARTSSTGTDGASGEGASGNSLESSTARSVSNVSSVPSIDDLIAPVELDTAAPHTQQILLDTAGDTTSSSSSGGVRYLILPLPPECIAFCLSQREAHTPKRTPYGDVLTRYLYADRIFESDEEGEGAADSSAGGSDRGPSAGLWDQIAQSTTQWLSAGSGSTRRSGNNGGGSADGVSVNGNSSELLPAALAFWQRHLENTEYYSQTGAPDPTVALHGQQFAVAVHTALRFAASSFNEAVRARETAHATSKLTTRFPPASGMTSDSGSVASVSSAATGIGSRMAGASNGLPQTQRVSNPRAGATATAIRTSSSSSASSAPTLVSNNTDLYAASELSSVLGKRPRPVVDPTSHRTLPFQLSSTAVPSSSSSAMMQSTAAGSSAVVSTSSAWDLDAELEAHRARYSLPEGGTQLVGPWQSRKSTQPLPTSFNQSTTTHTSTLPLAAASSSHTLTHANTTYTRGATTDSRRDAFARADDTRRRWYRYAAPSTPLFELQRACALTTGGELAAKFPFLTHDSLHDTRPGSLEGQFALGELVFTDGSGAYACVAIDEMGVGSTLARRLRREVLVDRSIRCATEWATHCGDAVAVSAYIFTNEEGPTHVKDVSLEQVHSSDSEGEGESEGTCSDATASGANDRDATTASHNIGASVRAGAGAGRVWDSGKDGQYSSRTHGVAVCCRECDMPVHVCSCERSREAQDDAMRDSDEGDTRTLPTYRASTPQPSVSTQAPIASSSSGQITADGSPLSDVKGLLMRHLDASVTSPGKRRSDGTSATATVSASPTIQGTQGETAAALTPGPSPKTAKLKLGAEPTWAQQHPDVPWDGQTCFFCGIRADPPARPCLKACSHSGRFQRVPGMVVGVSFSDAPAVTVKVKGAASTCKSPIKQQATASAASPVPGKAIVTDAATAHATPPSATTSAATATATSDESASAVAGSGVPSANPPLVQPWVAIHPNVVWDKDLCAYCGTQGAAAAKCMQSCQRSRAFAPLPPMQPGLTFTQALEAAGGSGDATASGTDVVASPPLLRPWISYHPLHPWDGVSCVYCGNSTRKGGGKCKKHSNYRLVPAMAKGDTWAGVTFGSGARRTDATAGNTATPVNWVTQPRYPTAADYAALLPDPRAIKNGKLAPWIARNPEVSWDGKTCLYCGQPPLAGSGVCVGACKASGVYSCPEPMKTGNSWLTRKHMKAPAVRDPAAGFPVWPFALEQYSQRLLARDKTAGAHRFLQVLANATTSDRSMWTRNWELEPLPEASLLPVLPLSAHTEELESELDLLLPAARGTASSTATSGWPTEGGVKRDSAANASHSAVVPTVTAKSVLSSSQVHKTAAATASELDQPSKRSRWS